MLVFAQQYIYRQRHPDLALHAAAASLAALLFTSLPSSGSKAAAVRVVSQLICSAARLTDSLSSPLSSPPSSPDKENVRDSRYNCKQQVLPLDLSLKPPAADKQQPANAAQQRLQAKGDDTTSGGGGAATSGRPSAQQSRQQQQHKQGAVVGGGVQPPSRRLVLKKPGSSSSSSSKFSHVKSKVWSSLLKLDSLDGLQPEAAAAAQAQPEVSLGGEQDGSLQEPRQQQQHSASCAPEAERRARDVRSQQLLEAPVPAAGMVRAAPGCSSSSSCSAAKPAAADPLEQYEQQCCNDPSFTALLDELLQQSVGDLLFNEPHAAVAVPVAAAAPVVAPVSFLPDKGAGAAASAAAKQNPQQQSGVNNGSSSSSSPLASPRAAAYAVAVDALTASVTKLAIDGRQPLSPRTLNQNAGSTFAFQSQRPVNGGSSSSSSSDAAAVFCRTETSRHVLPAAAATEPQRSPSLAGPAAPLAAAASAAPLEQQQQQRGVGTGVGAPASAAGASKSTARLIIGRVADVVVYATREPPHGSWRLLAERSSSSSAAASAACLPVSCFGLRAPVASGAGGGGGSSSRQSLLPAVGSMSLDAVRREKAELKAALRGVESTFGAMSGAPMSKEDKEALREVYVRYHKLSHALKKAAATAAAGTALVAPAAAATAPAPVAPVAAAAVAGGLGSDGARGSAAADGAAAADGSAVAGALGAQPGDGSWDGNSNSGSSNRRRLSAEDPLEGLYDL